MNKVLDNPFYYLDNFGLVLDWIASRYADLLTPEEQNFISRFSTLPQPARALFVRMVMRKGTLFRASKLNYAEIGCSTEAARQLLTTGWVEADPVLTLDQLFELLTKPEIAGLFGLSLHSKGARKAEQLEALRPQFSDPRPFSSWFRDAGDTVLSLLVMPLCDRLRLIFFGNARQDWTDIVLADLGIFQYEKVEFSPSSRGFRTRRDVDHYLELHHCHERFAAGETLAAVLAALPEARADNEWLGSRRNKLLFQIARQAERGQEWELAHRLYAACPYPGARARTIRVLEKSGREADAYALLEAAMQAPESDAEHQQLLRIAPRLQRRLGHPVLRTARSEAAERIDLVLPMPQQEWWVEGVVRDHLARPEAPVYYVENALINGLFGLLCWPAIFSAIPGAFFHPFHHGPVDLHSADFYPRREAAFRACLGQLDSGAYRATILAAYAAKRNVQSPFVAWDFLDEALIALALDCIPAAHLKLWFGRILDDIKGNRSGFPDLIQFWPAERRYNMIEVKGPGDRLQDSQLRWIDFCAEHGMPVSVCYLRWSGEAA